VILILSVRLKHVTYVLITYILVYISLLQVYTRV